MQSIINANKIYDLNLYSECEYYLNSLRQYANQFEMYKRIEMEHKRGQFLREEVKGKSKTILKFIFVLYVGMRLKYWTSLIHFCLI